MRCQPRRGPAGFTLIEVMLVVLIIAIVGGVVVPRFVRSFESVQRQVAARSIVAAGRYARGAAVLRQHDMAVCFDLRRRRVEVVSIDFRAGARERTAFLDRREAEEMGTAVASRESDAAAGPSITGEIVRDLPEDMTIEGVEADNHEIEHVRDVYWVYYYPSGMSDSYRVRLRDGDKRLLVVEVDGISGKAVVRED